MSTIIAQAVSDVSIQVERRPMYGILGLNGTELLPQLVAAGSFRGQFALFIAVSNSIQDRSSVSRIYKELYQRIHE